jgi:hypothetical protein
VECEVQLRLYHLWICLCELESRVSGIMVSWSKHFIVIDVSATVRKSFRKVTLDFLGTGTMVVSFKHVGISDCDKERLKMSEKTFAIWSVHALRTHPGIPSGPAALWVLTCLNVFLTSVTESQITQSPEITGGFMQDHWWTGEITSQQVLGVCCLSMLS